MTDRRDDAAMKTLRDPVNDYISFSSDEQRLVDSPWFQRLRHCSQNGPARLGLGLNTRSA
jgi:HD superfamily phosphohydrolase